MRSVFCAIALSAFVLFAVSPVHGVRIKQKRSVLVVYHERGEVDVESPSGTKISTLELADKVPLEVEPGETIRVSVADPNPLLFNYAWKESPRTETADHKSAAEFAKAARTLLTLLAPFGTTAQAEASNTAGETAQNARIAAKLPSLGQEDKAVVDQVIKDLDQLTKWAEAIPGLIDQSATAADEVKKTVLEWHVPVVAKSIESNLDRLDTVEAHLIRDIQSSRSDETIADKLGANIQNEDKKPESKKDKKDKNISVESSGSGDKAGAVATGPSEGAGNTSEGTTIGSDSGLDPLVVLLLLAKDQDPKVRELLTRVKAFATLAEKIHVPIPFDPPITFDPVNNGGGFLTIAAVEENATQAARAKLKTGTFDFNVAPASPVHYSIGGGAVYSFVELQKFGTETKDGKTTIVRKDNGNEVSGANGVVMLSITPDAWSQEIFGGSFQLGLSPVQDKIGIFLGGSIRLYNLVSIGLGAAYQQAERLAAGLRVGQEIATAGALKTNTVFKSGLYLTLTFDLRKFN